MTTINLDDDEHVDWLHSRVVDFTISQDGVEVGTANIKTGEIETEDEELAELFYQLIDEENIGEYAGVEFAEALKDQGYIAEPKKDSEKKVEESDDDGNG